MGFTFSLVSSIMQQRMRLKSVLLVGAVLSVIGSILLPFANSPERYWSFVFPAFIIGSAGITIVFATIKWVVQRAPHSLVNILVSISIFVTTPPEAAGVVGAIFSCSLQVGCAAGMAIITSIQTSIEAEQGGPNSYDGRAAGFWFLFAFTCLMGIGLLVFMKDTLPPLKHDPTNGLEHAVMDKEGKTDETTSSVA
jgi:hypothetical protein